MYHASSDRKLILLASNIPLLLIAKKDFWIGVTTFLVSMMYHYKQITTTDMEEINRVCTLDVIMTLILVFYLLFTNTVETLSYVQILPIVMILWTPRRYGLQNYYAEFHSLWHIISAIVVFRLLK
jgi:hypothetical protein